MNESKITLDMLAEIRQKANLASSNSDGRWGIVDSPYTGGWGLCIHDHGDIIARSTGRDKKWKTSVFNHIASADPATVLAMVHEIEQLRSELAVVNLALRNAESDYWCGMGFEFDDEVIDRYSKNSIENARRQLNAEKRSNRE